MYGISNAAPDFKSHPCQILCLTEHGNGMDLKSKSLQFHSIPARRTRPKIFKCDFFIRERSFVAAVGKWVGIQSLVGFVNVYGPRDMKERKEVWEMLELLCKKEEVKWCVFGDFNEVRGDHERLNSVTNATGVEDFNDFIRRCSLVEIPLGNQKFTRVSDDGRKHSKLDRFLVSREFDLSWRNLGVKALERKWSDHFPLLLNDSDHDFGPKPFKLFDTWLEEDVGDLVKEAWEKEVRSRKLDRVVLGKLKNVKTALKVWCNKKFKDVNKDLERYKEETKRWESLMVERNLDEEENDNWVLARKRWLEAEKRTLEMARQKAKIKWIGDGDDNSRMFHAAIKKKLRTNGIRGLNINAEWSEDPKKLKDAAFKFFKERFSSNYKEGPKLRSDKIRKLSESEAAKLEVPFTEAEVLEAMKDCGNNKSPGPDGFTIKFFKKFWPLVKEVFMRALENFWERMEIFDGCIASFLTLVPKNPNPIGLNEYRPISLIGIFYKIISKVLMGRLRNVMSHLVGDKQSAILKGRNILDGILIANEVVEDLKKSKKKGMVFKVDFEKAYDSVEWPFLMDLLELMGFGTRWRKWIQSCLSSASVSVLVNGSPTKEFKMERGLRQGDPLAPFLFLLVAESLNVLMLEAREKGIFEGVLIGKNEVAVTHLQYADDVIFFGKWSPNNLRNLIKILRCFHDLSRLRINISKSKLYGVGVENEEIRLWANNMGCGYGSLPFTYLSLPVGANMNRIENWSGVVDKMKNKLASWKAKLISFGGRLTLVKTVLGNLML